jgi:hypothetical protein
MHYPYNTSPVNIRDLYKLARAGGTVAFVFQRIADQVCHILNTRQSDESFARQLGSVA